MGYSLNFCVLLNSSLIAVNHHVPAGLAEGELILLGDLIKHTAGCQRDGEVALIAAAASPAPAPVRLAVGCRI